MSFLVPAEAPPSPPAATAEAPSTTADCCATSPTTVVEVMPSSTPAGTAPSLDPEQFVSWSSLTDDEEDEDSEDEGDEDEDSDEEGYDDDDEAVTATFGCEF